MRTVERWLVSIDFIHKMREPHKKYTDIVVKQLRYRQKVSNLLLSDSIHWIQFTFEWNVKKRA